MKKIIVLTILFLSISFSTYSFGRTYNYHFGYLNNQIVCLPQFVNLQVSDEIQKTKLIETSFIYKNTIRVILIFILVVIVLVIISVPLIMAYNLLTNLLEYNKKFKHKIQTNFWLNESEKNNFKTLKRDIKKAVKNIKKANKNKSLEQLEYNEFGKIIQENNNTIYEKTSKLLMLKELPESIWKEYCKIFTNMTGYGFGFITWVFSSYFYIVLNYNSFENGLIDYFKFPFKFLKSIPLSSNSESLNQELPMEIWVNMVFIFSVTALAFFIGKFIGLILIFIENEKPPIIKMSNIDLH